MNKISKEINIGTVGELLVILRLLQYGVQAAPPLKDSGNDLIAVKGDEFRAIQIKTSTTGKFDLRNLPNLYHIVALVYLVVQEDDSFELEQSRIFLLEIGQICQTSYAMSRLKGYAIDQNLIDTLFNVEPRVAVFTDEVFN